MRDILPLFNCLVELDATTGKYKATSRDFHRMEGYGETPEAAAASLRYIILETWGTFRDNKPL